MAKLPAIACWAEEPPLRTLFCLPCVLNHTVALAATQTESVVDSPTSDHLIEQIQLLSPKEIHLLRLKDPTATPRAAIRGSLSRLDVGRVAHRCRHDQVPLLRVEPSHGAGAGSRLGTVTIARSCSRGCPRGRSAPRSSAVGSEMILYKSVLIKVTRT